MASKSELTGKKVLLMAIVTGIIVANLNYIQPIEGLIATTINVSKASVGVVATLSQLGYAFGLLLIVPLGDIFNRYHLIQTMLCLSIVALLLAFWSPNITIFAIAALLVGVTSVAAQIIVPYAAYLAEPLPRGRILGNILSGLLTGILLSRSVSGLLGGVLIWQYVYLIAAFASIVLLVVLHVALPRDPRAHQRMNYLKVLATLPHLLRKSKYLQGSAINGLCLFGVSNVLWSTLAFYLEKEHHYGREVAGLLGLLEITSILLASSIGKAVDTYSPRITIVLEILFSAVSFVVFAFLGHYFRGLILGIILLDIGTQTGQVSNQAIVQSISMKESSRNNSIFMFSYFLGGSIGTFSATLAWTNWGWLGVCSVAAVFLLIALISHFVLREPQKLVHEID